MRYFGLDSIFHFCVDLDFLHLVSVLRCVPERISTIQQM